jgi:hypothetical protein
MTQMLKIYADSENRQAWAPEICGHLFNLRRLRAFDTVPGTFVAMKTNMYLCST